MRRMFATVAIVSISLCSIARGTEVTTYTYDSLGRLKQARVAGDRGSGVQDDYVYDAVGNRTSSQSLGQSAPRLTSVTPASNSVNVSGSGGVLTLTVGSGATGSISVSMNGTFIPAGTVPATRPDGL